jgi:hypothetical protein
MIFFLLYPLVRLVCLIRGHLWYWAYAGWDQPPYNDKDGLEKVMFCERCGKDRDGLYKEIQRKKRARNDSLFKRKVHGL